MTINLSDLAGRSVFDVSTATAIGTVGYAILDADRAVVVALHLGKSSGSGPVLPWESIKAIGPDAVTVDSGDCTRQPVGRSEQRAVDGSLDPIGARALTDQGVAIGKVVDLAVDESSGAIEHVITDSETLDGSRVRGLGGYALIIGAATSPAA